MTPSEHCRRSPATSERYSRSRSRSIGTTTHSGGPTIFHVAIPLCCIRKRKAIEDLERTRFEERRLWHDTQSTEDPLISGDSQFGEYSILVALQELTSSTWHILFRWRFDLANGDFDLQLASIVNEPPRNRMCQVLEVSSCRATRMEY